MLRYQMLPSADVKAIVAATIKSNAVSGQCIHNASCMISCASLSYDVVWVDTGCFVGCRRS